MQDGGRRTNFNIVIPYISGQAKARDFKFGLHIAYMYHKQVQNYATASGPKLNHAVIFTICGQL